MQIFKYETHLHTFQGSACGQTKGEDYIKPFFDAGYSGIFVTDHFFGGNTRALRDGEWKSRIESYCSGYESAKKAADEFNKKNNFFGTEKEFKVFFGIEQTFNGDDYLVYGFDKSWLINHPEIENMNHKELFEAVNSVNGLMIQAHPFRFRNYMDAIHLHIREVHGVEIYNSGNKSEENLLAKIYASQYNFPTTSGSDIHNVEKLFSKEGLKMGGVYFDSPLNSVFDYAERIKEKKVNLITDFV